MLERKELISLLTHFDIALVPLTTRIYGSVPSKIFEYSTLGIPILYFGGGEGENLIRENHLGWVADVGDFEELNYVLKTISKIKKNEIISIKNNVFKYSKTKFNLDVQIKNLIINGVF